MYRAEGESPWEGSWRKLEGQAEAERRGRIRRGSRAVQGSAAGSVELPRVFRYRDRDVRPGVVHRYRVRPVGPDGGEGADGPAVAARPGVATTVVVSALSRTEVEVAWTPLPEPDVFRYEVERAPVEVLTEDPRTGARRKCCDAYLTFVALDRDGRPTPAPPLLPTTDEERRRERDARVRRESRLALRAALRGR